MHPERLALYGDRHHFADLQSLVVVADLETGKVPVICARSFGCAGQQLLSVIVPGRQHP